MSFVSFTKTELAAAITRGVRQLVVIGSWLPLPEVLQNCSGEDVQVFAVDEERSGDSVATFVPTQFETEALDTSLERSDFDKRKASLFLWLGGAGYRTVEAAIASLSFIASLPKGSGVVFDYAVERTCVPSVAHTALDAMASRLLVAGGHVRYLIQPQAVLALLRGLGFQKILDLAQDELPVTGGHLVSAVV